MQRRLEIARGLLHAPRVLFLDEPTVGLDPQTRSSIWEYINDLKRREDITIFLTTHYMDEAENCDRIAIIDHGRIVAIDTPAALKASIGKDLRAATIVWRRELIRFKRDRLRAVTSLIQPLLFLLVLGTGLAALAGGGMPAGVNFKTFIYPGVLAMSVLFTAIFSAASIVWDREFGFLREMLVAPVSRAAIVTGKCLGGATIAPCKGS
jgi:energy-coupling factor transporter ATP-binding protein EcfA2